MKRTGALLILTLASGPLAAADFIVNNTADVQENTPGNGTCNPVNAAPGTCTLRAAIMEANALGGSHNILLASGTYALSRTGTGEDGALTGDLDITADITILNGTNNPPLINGNYDDRVFDIQDGGELTLVNIHVTGGEANSPGNTRGGGIQVANGATLTLEESILSANVANLGGGIYSDGTVSIEKSDVYNNVVTDEQVLSTIAGGAAILTRGTLSVTQSTFRSNGVIPGGEDMFLSSEYAIEARVGFPADPSILIFNSTFHGNTSGVFADEVPVGIYQSTFASNGARGLRFLPEVGNTNVQLQVISSVFSGHTSDCNGPYIPLNDSDNRYDVENRTNASSDTSCSFTGASDFENIENPFQDDQPTDHGGPTLVLMPNPQSPIVDPPIETCVTLIDQRDRTRPINGSGKGARCDIGAVELDPSTDPRPRGIFSDGFEFGGP